MLDILGFVEMAKDAQRDRTEDAFLNRLYLALEHGRNHWLEQDKWIETQAATSAGHLLPKDNYALKAFTDNIVIGWPIRDDGEGELGQAFFALSLFQYEMINAGFLLRGAISVGNLYVDDIAVVGGGLIEAYEGEASLARDPRIILTSSATRAVKQHLEYYGSRSGGGSHAPQNRKLLQDADGQLFLNYLDTTVLIDEDNPGYEMLDIHSRCGHCGRKLKVLHHARRDSRYLCNAEMDYASDKKCITFSNMRVDNVMRTGILDVGRSPGRSSMMQLPSVRLLSISSLM